MKALSLRPFWADFVTFEGKTIECRTWQTDYRGDLLICASSRKESGFISGKAMCIVELTDIEPFTREHLEAAGMMPDMMPDNPSFAWHLDNLLWIEPFDVKGKLHLFDVDDELIHPLPPIATHRDRGAVRGWRKGALPAARLLREGRRRGPRVVVREGRLRCQVTIMASATDRRP